VLSGVKYVHRYTYGKFAAVLRFLWIKTLIYLFTQAQCLPICSQFPILQLGTGLSVSLPYPVIRLGALVS
jgi:hypothetical protein